jgi:hypothetical protein
MIEMDDRTLRRADALGEATRAAVHPCSPLPLRPAASQLDLAAINDKAMTAIIPNQRLYQDE